MNVVVTGGTKGIGLAIVELLIAQDCSVCICARNEEDLLALERRIREKKPEAILHIKSADLSIKEQVFDFAEFCLNAFDKIDVLINNAGVFFPGDVHSEADGILEKMIETNLYSAYYLTKKLVPTMIEVGDGQVINMCSIASKIALPGGGSYTISKFAMLGFSKVLREELKDKGVRVTSILPGATWSNSWKGVELPIDRLMQAKDIAKTVWNAISLSKTAVVEEIIIRPQLGDL